MSDIRPEMVVRSPVARVQRSSKTKFDEVGTTGLRQYGGFIAEEWLRKLAGQRRAWVFREMADNDPTVGALLFAFEMLARGVEWSVEEGGDPKAAEFVEECLEDMSSTWGDTISEILTMLVHGWAYHEIVYKRREGPEAEVPSRFSDGKIGWRKIPIRAQETLWRWDLDDNGGIQALEQIGWDGTKRTVPIEKSLLFRTKTVKNNPEGRSLLRNAFLPWFRKKNIEEIEAIGIERDLAGLPALTAPEGVDIFGDGNKELREAAEELVTTVKRDEDEGLVLPHGWEFDLVSTGGSRQIDTNATIRRYALDIATSVLADMLLIGQDKVGSYAMVDVKADIFGAAVDTILDAIADVFNRYAIPRLLALNGFSLDDPPQLRHGTTKRVDLDAVAQMLERLSSTGAVVFPDNDLLAALYKEAGLPAPAVIEAEKTEDREADLPPLGKAYVASGRHLEHSLRGKMNLVLKDFGEEAASSYERIVNKAAPLTAEDQAVADQILRNVGAAGFARKMARTWFDHYGHVADDVLKAFRQNLADNGRTTDIGLTKQARAQILRDGGLRVGMLDIEKQLRDSIYKALADAREASEGWAEAANRIRRYVPAGRFQKAGTAYRSQLIARTETGNAQRTVQIEAYKAHPEVKEVELLDGLLANSDPECIERSGTTMSFADAEMEAASEHPNGTLMFLPVFS